MTLTMGSLFDGIGGFPLAAVRAGMKDNQRTVAFQVDADLFERFKEYRKANGIKQNAFFLNCIRQALGETERQRQAE